MIINTKTKVKNVKPQRCFSSQKKYIRQDLAQLKVKQETFLSEETMNQFCIGVADWLSKIHQTNPNNTYIRKLFNPESRMEHFEIFEVKEELK